MPNRCSIGWLIVFLLALAAESTYCFRHPIAYFDTLAYVSLAECPGAENDFGGLGERCARELPGAYSGCHEVAGSEVFHQAAALNPEEYRTFLRFYTVKPFYNELVHGLSRLLNKGAFFTLRLVSTASFFSIGLVLVIWLRGLVSPGVASLASLCLVSLPATMGLGRGLLPDALLTALLLLRACLLAKGRRAGWGAAVLLLATLVRVDALLFGAACMAVLVWHCRMGMRRWQGLTALAAGAVAWVDGIGRLGDALPWRVLFVRSFIAWTAPARYGALHVSIRDYLHVIASNEVRTVLFCLALPGLLAVLALAPGRPNARLQWLVWAGLGAVMARVLLFPGVEDRYYVWLTLLAGVGAVSALAGFGGCVSGEGDATARLGSLK